MPRSGQRTFPRAHTLEPRLVTYVVPGAGTQDGTLGLRDVASGGRRTLGRFICAIVIRGSGGQADVVAESATGRTAIFDASGRTVWTGGTPRNLVAALAGDTIWMQLGQDAVPVGAGGKVATPRRLAAFHGRAPNWHKGLVGVGNTSTVGGWAIAPNGHVFAMGYDGYAAGAQDIMSGRSRRLPGYGVLQGAAVGSDGMLYTLAWKLISSTDTVHILRIDPATLRIVSDADTRLRLQRTDNAELLPTAHHGILALVARGDPGQPIQVSVFEADTRGRIGAGPTLPPNIGLAGTVVPNDDLLVYGGPARNKISLVNLDTGRLQPVPRYDGPIGSYVESVG